ncbi:MAG TPA: translocation/assembly module TamB domain-containing protein, partial [Candidatus Binatia bacterium]|nr:translocation/assembly module TamB domain-containing protein [Candidatus Binatia bacterium]
SENSSLEASGTVSNFDHPQLQLAGRSTIAMAQLGSIVRARQLHSGSLVVEASAAWSQAGGYATEGHIAAHNVDYRDGAIVLRNADLASNFSFSDDRLLLTRIAARLLGGEVTGDADIRNLAPALSLANTGPAGPQPVPRRSARERAPESARQQGSARLRIRALSLNELARMIPARSLPLDRLNPAGAVTGSVDLAWQGSVARAQADIAVEIAATAPPAAGQLPVTGRVRGRYSAASERIDLATLSLSTPHTHLEASGILGLTTAALRLNAQAGSLSELQPFLAAMRVTPPSVEFAGSASFSGTLNGRLRSPQIAGHLQATNFTYTYTPSAPAPAAMPRPKRAWLRPKASPAPPPPAPPAVQSRRIHVDEVAADLKYLQSGVTLHNAVIRNGGAQLTLDGAASLEDGNFTQDSQFRVQAVAKNADVADLQQAFGTDYPISGKLNFTLQAAGTVADPRGQGQISLTEGAARGRPVRSLTSKIAFAEHAARFVDIHLQAARGTVAGSAAYDFRSRAGQLDLHGQNINLADIAEVQTPRLHSEGVANFTLQGSGTLQHPVFNAHLEIGRLALNGDVIGSVTADAVTRGTRLTLTARSSFPNATLTLDGNADLEGEMPGSAQLRFSNLDVNPFLPAAMRNQVTRQASLDGEAQVSGPFRQPQLLRGHLRVQQFSVEVARIPIRSDGPVELGLANGMVEVQRCTTTSEDTRFTLTGGASLRSDRALDLRAGGSINLKLAQTLDPDLTSYGTSQVDLRIGGTLANPLLSGEVGIAHAGLSKVDLPVGFGDMNGKLQFDQDRLTIESLTGRMGGGRVTLVGFVTYGRTLGFNLTADGTDVRFRYAGISVTSDQTLRLTGTVQNSSLTGNITVTRFAQIPSNELPLMLAQATGPPTIPRPNSPLNNLHLEVRIISAPELTVETSLAKLSGDVDLRLRGTAARPVLLGRINVAEGDIRLSGTKYHIDRGDITFLNPVHIEPVLDVEATTRVRDYDITIGLHGTLERLNTTYRSDPPLSTDDIISLLAFGRTQTENALGATPSPGFTESASGALLSSALNQAVTSRVSKIFGSSAIRINPSLGGPENDPNARLTLEQQVSNNVTFTYITNLARSAQEVIQFEYNINSEYTLQGLRDENGVVSFDLLIRKRKR